MTMPTHSPDQQPWGPPGMQPPPAQPRNGLGTTALVLGIVGLVLAIIPFLFWLGGILGLLALIFGIVGASRAGKGLATNKGAAISGLVLGAVSIVVSIAWTVVIATAVKDVADEIEKSGGLPTAGSSAKPGAKGTTPTDAPTTEAPAGADSGALKFGETFAYEDGVKVTVSRPEAHTPDGFAVGYTKGKHKAFQVTVTIVNGSKEAIDITAALPNASDAAGASAELVFDGSNSTKPFEGKVLPGKQAKADFTFALAADAAGELQVEISPTVLDHESAVWTGPTK
ncbi:DUF4190 domain-containing protein [Streptomyces sp. NPDC057411]|uniref:DUF4190 domain-containing protein n=1 Tax=unclassified Streptomyces TaxID=2593676 RepID=UPI0036403DEA